MKTTLLSLIALTFGRSTRIVGLVSFWTLLIGSFVAGNLSAATLTLYTNNFDSYAGAATNFSDLAVMALPTGPGGVRVEDGLATANSPGGLGFNGVQLINWDSAPGSGPNCMLLRPGTAFRCTFDPRGGSNYVWDFWMLSSKSGTANRGFRISLLDEGADQNAHDFLIFRSGQGTTASITGTDGVDIMQPYNGFPGGGWVTISNQFAGTPVYVTNNVWAHYKVVADAVTRTFQFYVNGNLVNTNAHLSRPQDLVVSSIRFANEGNSSDDGYTLIDNVSLTVDGNFIDLAGGPFTEGFESYTASTSGNVGDANTDNDPGGPWVTAETIGVENGKAFTSNAVQVVDSSVTAPHSGSRCLMVSQGQTAGSTISWAQATDEDVKITWWAKVPAADDTPGTYSVYLRVSLYAWEAEYSAASDTILIGYGHRGGNPTGDATSIMTYSRWFSEWWANGSWGDTGGDFTPDTWEEYQLTTDVKHNSYTLVKNPSSTPVVIIKDGQYISSWGNNKRFHTVAFSTSNNSIYGANPPTYIDDIMVEPYTNTGAPEPRPYDIMGTGPAARFTNYTVLNIPGRTPGGVAIDPRDTNTIVFTVDEEVNGAIMKATKVASGNWVIDPTPLVSGLYNPNGLTVDTNGTIWFVRDSVKGGQGCGLSRLQAPWASNVVEEIVRDFGSAPTNRQDQPCDLAFYMDGGSRKLAVLDRGVDGSNNPNAIWTADPATVAVNQAVYNEGGANQLVAPDATAFGFGLGGNANGIAWLAVSNELVTIWEGDGTTANGVIACWDATTGVNTRYIDTSASGITFGVGIDVDPTTGRIWAADNVRQFYPLSEFAAPQIVSFPADGTPGSFTRELWFTNSVPAADRPDRIIRMKDPGLRFSQDGAFLVVSDGGLFSGGGRLLIFHSEPFVVPPITITSVSRNNGDTSLSWTPGGAVIYEVQRSTTVDGPYITVSDSLVNTSFTDTAASSGSAFYKVLAYPQN